MSSKQRKFQRIMHYAVLLCERGYWLNKSKNPAVTARRQFHRAFNENREDADCQFYRDIRELGQDAFIVRYCLELPDWAECRSHYVPITPEQYEELRPKVEALMVEPIPPIKPLTRKQKEELAAKGEYTWNSKKNG